MPAKPAVRRTSLSPPGNKLFFRTGRASSHRPLFASLRAREKVTEDTGDGAFFDLWVEAGAEINKKTRAVTRSLDIEIGQTCDNACPMIPRLIIQFQSKLDIPRILRRVDQAHVPAAAGCSRSIQVHTIEGIEKVGSELKSHSLRDREILL